MRITLIQDLIHWADIDSNLKKTETQLLELAGKTDLVVLPEMFTTGFCTDQPNLAETMEGKSITRLKSWAIKYNFAIAGSLIISENGANFNRGFFIFPDGKIKTVDKRHLFSLGAENIHFSAGNKKTIINYCGFNIRLLICYDVRFPIWTRNINNEYDLLIFVANFPKNRIKAWDILLQARAIENQAYVCGVNCIGTEGLGTTYNGHSTLLNYFATPLLHFPENETSIQTYELEIESLIKFRTKSAFWKDADEFEIIL